MKTYNAKVLVADDEPSLRQILATRLSMLGYDVATAADGEETLSTFSQNDSDLVVLDVMMPKLDGFSVCQQLREKSNVPIIMLSSLGDVSDRISGLELGADDYIVKPFSLKELESRIHSVLRRIKKTRVQVSPSLGLIEVDSLRIDMNKRQVSRDNQRVHLTGMEFNLLKLLVSHAGEAFSRVEILQQVWGYTPGAHADTRIVDVHISRLRAKLEDDPSHPELILTTRGTGYLFQRIFPLEMAEKSA